VWVDERRKLAAVGVRVRRGVTTHGLALNVSADLRWFAEMIPCGIPGCEVTTLEREVGRPIPMPVVRDAVARNLARALRVKLAEDP
jgi:lipoate-protein ligase B